MGRHTRHPAEAGAGDRSGRSRRLGPIPLLPTVAGVMALAAVASAVSTKQISLNFAGGPPTQGPTPRALGTEAVTPPGPHPGRSARHDSVRSSAPRTSRGTGHTPVTVTFRKVSSRPGGFEGQVTIANRGTRTIRGWTLVAHYRGTRILNVWNVIVVNAGTTLVVRNPLARPSIAPGQRVRVSFTATGDSAQPFSCTFNGEPCRP